MKGYLMTTANSVKSSFTYRAHILFQILTTCTTIVILHYLWRAVYGSVDGGVQAGLIKGMSFRQTFLYVSVASAVTVLTRTWTDWEMNGQIRSGDIIVFFFKPFDYMGFMFSSGAGFIIGNFITITLPSFVLIFGVFGYALPGPLQAVLFTTAVAGSAVLVFLFDFLVGTLCFWTQSVWGLSVAKDLIITFLSGALMPLAFYPRALLDVIEWLPFPYIYNLPLSIIIHEGTDFAWAFRGLGIQACWIVAVFAFVRLNFSISRQKLAVAGG